MMRPLIELVWPDSMKSSHPERSGHDDIKQKNSPKKRLECPTRSSREAICIRVFRDNAKQMRTSQRCNVKKEAVQLGRRGRMTTKRTLAKNQTGIK